MSNVVGSLDGKPSASPSGGNNAGSIPAPTAKKGGPCLHVKHLRVRGAVASQPSG